MNPNQNLAGLLAAGFLCLALVFLIGAVISGLFCYSLSRTMAAVRPRNRRMPAGLVWLHLIHLLGTGTGVIPVVGMYLSAVIAIGAGVWDIVMVLKIAASVRAEYKAQKLRIGNDNFGKTVGLTWACMVLGLPIVGLLVGIGVEAIGVDQDLVAIFGIVVLLAYVVLLVLFIMYWVQIHGYGTRIRESGGGRRRSAEEDDYEDDYRPRRGRARRDEDDEDEEERPRRRRRDEDDDEEDDRPRRRRRRDEDDD